MAFEDELRTLQSQVSTASSRKTRAEIEVENATRNLTDARTRLETEYGVTDNEGVKRVLAELQTDLDEKLASAKAALAEAGA